MPFDKSLHFLRWAAEVGRHVVKRILNSRGSRRRTSVEGRQVVKIFVGQVAVGIEIGMLEEE